MSDLLEELEIESESLYSDALSSLIGILMKSFGTFLEYMGHPLDKEDHMKDTCAV